MQLKGRPMDPSIMEGYIQYLTNNNKMSESNAKLYVNIIRKLQNCVGKSYVDIEKIDIQHYLSFLRDKVQLKESTLYVHLSAIKKFYDFLLVRGDISKAPSEGIRIRYWSKNHAKTQPLKMRFKNYQES